MGGGGVGGVQVHHAPTIGFISVPANLSFLLTVFTRSRDSDSPPKGKGGRGGGEWEEGEREEPFSLPLIPEQRPGEIPEI